MARVFFRLHCYMPNETLYLIDGHAHFFRAYHAIRTAMTSPVTQEPTNMTYGFTAMLLKLMRDYSPDYLAVVIDVAGDRESFRSEIYPDYKANREPPPSDFKPQVTRCLEVLEAFGIPVLGQDRVEADDVIATISKQIGAVDNGINVRIISKDKDLTQINFPGVEMFDIYKDEVVDPAKIFKTDGVQPEHVRDILALMGDSVDNVPGVPGIGPKTAAKLILQYGSIKKLYDHIEEIKGKRRENLEQSRDDVLRSMKLVSLVDDCEVDFKIESARLQPQQFDVAKLHGIFDQLGFNRHKTDVSALAGGEDAGTDNGKGGNRELADSNSQTVGESNEGGGGIGGRIVGGFGGGLFSHLDAPQPTAHKPGDYYGVESIAALKKLATKIRKAGCFTFDTETTGLSPLQSDLVGISVSLQEMEAYYIPLIADNEEVLPRDEVLKIMQPIFEDEKIEKTAHNLKFDMNVLRKHGIHLRGKMFDTIVASYVLDASRTSHSMNALSLAHLQHTCQPITELIGSGTKQRSFSTVPLEAAINYAAEDADITQRLRVLFEKQLGKSDLRKLFDDVEMPLVEVLAELEFNGIRVDPDELDGQREVLAERIDALRSEIIDASPHVFNPDSPKQLAAALFNKPDAEPPGLGIRPLKRNKTGPSTDAEVLEKLAADPEVDSPVPKLIVEYRQLTKLVNTYLVALKEAINPDTGRVHASFNQTVAATGRLSSSDPNLQNIPIRTEVGRDIRKAFVAEPGHVLITADYSQIELRLLAHLSEDEALIEAFQQGQDIHTAVAAEVYGISPDEVTSQQRGSAKMVNFGIIYGVTAFGLARRLGQDVSNSDAQKIIDDYKARFTGIDRFLQQCVEEALANGHVETILKRRRAIPQIHDRNQARRSLGERMAINTVVQGSAADLIKLAMIDLHAQLPKKFSDTKMLLQIHDELVFESSESDAEKVQSFVVKRMEAAMKLAVPLKVEAAATKSWSDAK